MLQFCFCVLGRFSLLFWIVIAVPYLGPRELKPKINLPQHKD